MVEGVSKRRHADLLRSSVWLSGGSAAVSLTGFASWALVSSRVDAATVGRAAALFSLTLLLVYLTAAGLPMAVARYSRDRSVDAGIAFTWACVLTTATSMLGAAVLVAIGPKSIQPVVERWTSFGAFLAFAALVAGLSLSAGLDLRLTAVRRRAWGAASWLVAGVARLPVLLLLPVTTGAAALWLVIAGSLALRGPVAIAALRRTVGPLRVRPVPARWPSMLEYTGVNALSQLVEEAPFILLPVLVLAHVTASTNAAFYVAWSFAMGIFILLRMISNSLLVEGVADGEELRHQTRFALLVSLGCAATATALSFLGAVVIIWAFGSAYRPGAEVLPVLTGASLFGAVSATLLGEARVRHDRASVVAIPLVLGVVVLGLAAATIDSNGIDGVAWSWFVGHGFAAGTAVLMRRRAVRHGRGTPLLGRATTQAPRS
jgi:O-antigen/teichoic acid export membrane protein